MILTKWLQIEVQSIIEHFNRKLISSFKYSYLRIHRHWIPQFFELDKKTVSFKMSDMNSDMKIASEAQSISIMPKEGEAMVKTIDLNVAKMSVTISEMIANTCGKSVGQQIKEDLKDKPIELKNISANILDKIIEYMNYHYDDPVEERDSDEEDYNDFKRSDDICDWDRRFMKDMDRDTLFELILAANYLNIKGLLELGCKTAANQIKGKSAEEVRQMWGIECDLSPEEEEKLKKENAWAEDNWRPLDLLL